MQSDLDINKDTPSDYALLVRNIKLEMTQEEFKVQFESIFNVKVYEVIFCCEVEKMIQLNKTVAKMNYLKGMCKIHDLKEMKRLGCTKEDLENNKDYAKPTKRKKFRFWKSRVLDKK